MSDLTPEMLAELKRLEQAATRTPWLVQEGWAGNTLAPFITRAGTDGIRLWDKQDRRDGDLITALRNAAPALIAAAEECERLRGLLGNLESCPFCRYWKHRGHATDCPTSRRD